MAGSILVGVDASTPSRSAIRWSVSRASATGAALELLHVNVGETHDDAAQLLRGELAIDSAPGRGTRVRARIPVARQEAP